MSGVSDGERALPSFKSDATLTSSVGTFMSQWEKAFDAEGKVESASGRSSSDSH